MQSQKFTAVVESMQRGETLVALKTISTLTSKEKNKAKLSENELKLIYVLKALCLLKIHEYGESYVLTTNFLKNEKDVLISETNVIHWLDYIASGLHLYKEVREFSGSFYNKGGNKEEILIEYMNLCIKECNYHEVFSSALRLYKLTNNIKYMFINVVYQYQALLRSSNESELPKKLEIVFLFSEKLLKELKIDDENLKHERIHKQAVKFSLKVCLKQLKYTKAQEILIKFQWAFEDQIEFLEHFYELNILLKTEESRILLLNMNYVRYKKEENLDSFVMEFQIYKKFVEFLFENLQNLEYPDNFFQEINDSQNIFKPFKENLNNDVVLMDFFKNLRSLKLFLSNQKAHKNYKSLLQIILSAEILILLKSLNILSNNNEQKALILPYYQKILEEYIDNFFNTMTFSEELQVLTRGASSEILENSIKSLENKIDLKPMNKYIKEINLMKLKLAWKFGEKPETIEGVLSLMKHSIRLYEQAYLELDLEKKPLEKGERHFIDDFLMISADVLIHFIRSQLTLDNSTLPYILKLITILEAGLSKSPYNFDIKLRLLIFYEILSCPERSIEILRTLDIKSVQHDTLGFLYGKIALNYQNFNLTQDFFTGALNYYSENLRESKESILACLKNGTYDKFEEFELYDKWIDFSYYKQICYFTKLETFIKTPKVYEENINYYINFIKKRLENTEKLTWNLDMKVLQPCFKGNAYWNYLDLFNNIEFFKLHFIRAQLENFLTKPENNENDTVLKEFCGIYDLVNIENMNNLDVFRRRNVEEFLKTDVFMKEMLNRRLSFEMMNLGLEKNLFVVSNKILKFKQEEAVIDEINQNLKEIISISSRLTDYFIESLKKDNLTLCFQKDVLMNIARYINKTIEIVQKYLKLVPELSPILNKAAKKGEEDLKKLTVSLQKTFNAGYKDLTEYSLKNLNVIHDFLQNLQDFSVEGKWGKKYKEILKENKEVFEELTLKNVELFRLENFEKLVVSTLLNEYTLFSTLNISNVKELTKTIKNLKI